MKKEYILPFALGLVAGLVIGYVSTVAVRQTRLGARLICPPPPAGHYYFDSVAGLDSNSGTDPATPWKTMAKFNSLSCSQLAPGATASFKNGSSYTVGMVVPCSGAVGNLVTINNYGTGSLPKITLPKVAGNIAIDFVGKNYVAVQNFRLVNGERGVVLEGGSNHDAVSGVVISGTLHDGIFVTDDGTKSGSGYHTITGNTISNGTIDAGQGWTGVFTWCETNAGAYCGYAGHNVIKSNTITNFPGDYSACVETDTANNEIANNTCSNAYYAYKTFEAGGASNWFHDNIGHDTVNFCGDIDTTGPGNIFDHNQFWNCGSHGIAVEDASGSPGTRTLNAVVKRNYVRNAGPQDFIAGIYCDTCTGALIFSNLLVNGKGSGIGMNNANGLLLYNNTTAGNIYGVTVQTSSSNVSIRNHLSSGDGTTLWVDSDSAAGFTSDYNNWNGTMGGSGYPGGQDAHSINAIPLFVSASALNFKLAAGSPCVDKGMALAQVPVDLDGVARPQGAAYDIGAYER